MVVPTFKPSTGEAEAGRSLRVQDSQGYYIGLKNPMYVYKSFLVFESYMYICVPGTCVFRGMKIAGESLEAASQAVWAACCGSW